MHAQGYYRLAEAAVDDPDELGRLAGAIERDGELTDEERGSCAARVGQYLGDHDRAEATVDEGEPMSDAELDG